jgi:predicted small metal-binding protein
VANQSNRNPGMIDPTSPTRGTEGVTRNTAGANPTANRPGAEGGNVGQNLRFRCSDAGFNGCNFEARGHDEQEILRQAEQHGRQQHGLKDFDDNTRNKVRGAIQRAA